MVDYIPSQTATITPWYTPAVETYWNANLPLGNIWPDLDITEKEQICNLVQARWSVLPFNDATWNYITDNGLGEPLLTAFFTHCRELGEQQGNVANKSMLLNLDADFNFNESDNVLKGIPAYSAAIISRFLQPQYGIKSTKNRLSPVKLGYSLPSTSITNRGTRVNQPDIPLTPSVNLQRFTGQAYHKVQLLATQTVRKEITGTGSSYIKDPDQVTFTVEDGVPEGFRLQESAADSHWILTPQFPPEGTNCIIMEVSDTPDADPFVTSCIPWMNLWGREIILLNDNDYFYARAASFNKESNTLAMQFGNVALPEGLTVKWYLGLLGASSGTGTVSAPSRTDAEINALISSYLTANPPDQRTDTEINGLIANYLVANPPDQRSDASINALIQTAIGMLPAHRTDAEVNTLIGDFLTANPLTSTFRGIYTTQQQLTSIPNPQNNQVALVVGSTSVLFLVYETDTWRNKATLTRLAQTQSQVDARIDTLVDNWARTNSGAAIPLPDTATRSDADINTLIANYLTANPPAGGGSGPVWTKVAAYTNTAGRAVTITSSGSLTFFDFAIVSGNGLYADIPTLARALGLRDALDGETIDYPIGVNISFPSVGDAFIGITGRDESNEYGVTTNSRGDLLGFVLRSPTTTRLNLGIESGSILLGNNISVDLWVLK